MTGENRRDNAREEMLRARACLAEARTLRGAGFPYGAASRSYYAVFHAGRALMFSVGLEVRSHRALLTMLGEHFIKPRRLAPEMGRLLAHMQRDREDADYQTGAVFTDEAVDEMLARADTFLAEVERLLGSAGEAG